LASPLLPPEATQTWSWVEVVHPPWLAQANRRLQEDSNNSKWFKCNRNKSHLKLLRSSEMKMTFKIVKHNYWSTPRNKDVNPEAKEKASTKMVSKIKFIHLKIQTSNSS
jgi:hypothetical protein